MAAKTGGVSDEAVRAKTGLDWQGWIERLDAAGARGRSHREIVALVRAVNEAMGGWWHQTVTVGYERATGARVKHETPGGFQVSASRTMAASVDEVFAAWSDGRRRAAWLDAGGKLTIRKATPGKSLRVAWPDETGVDVDLAAVGPAKIRVSVGHVKLPDAAAAAAAKAFWADALGRLKERLER